MNYVNLHFLIAAALLLASCSTKVESNVPPNFFEKPDPRALPDMSGPLKGSVDGAPWRAGKAIAREGTEEYSIAIASEGSEITCENSFPLEPHIAFIVPKSTGSYPYDGSGGGRLVNFIFPYLTENGGGSDNILAAKSQIDIESVVDGIISGRVGALSSADTSHTYSVGGEFAATICSEGPTPLQIVYEGKQAFSIAYSEAVKTKHRGRTVLEIRLMDKIPNRKCDPFSAWMMAEAPLKYLVLRAPMQEGTFDLSEGLLEYGDQGTSSGWVVDQFTGSARLSDLKANEVTFTLAATAEDGVELSASGQFTTTTCQ